MMEDMTGMAKVRKMDIMKNIGCQIPYWNMSKTFSNCTTKKELEKASTLLKEGVENVFNLKPPCKMIKQAQYDYKDVEHENEEQVGISIIIDFKILNHHYKEIRQVEAFHRK